VEQPHPLVARIVHDDVRPTAPRTSPGARFGRALSTTLIVLLTGFLAFMGFGGGDSAEAGLNPACVPDVNDAGPETYGGGIASMLPDPLGPGGDDDWSTDEVTALEWWGGAGTTFSWWAGEGPDGLDPDDDPCMALGMFWKNGLANIILDLSDMLSSVSISLYQWSNDPALMDSINEPVQCIVGGCNGAEGLKDALFLEYLTPIIVLGALWAGWQGLVKKRGSEATQGAIWMLAAATSGMLVMSHGSVALAWTDNVVSEINSTVISGVATMTANSQNAQMCDLSADAPQRGSRVSACALWKSLQYTPWSMGQFGPTAKTDHPISDADYTVRMGSGKEFTDLPIVQLDAQVLDHEEARTGADGSDNTGQLEAVKDQVVDERTGYMMWAGKEGAARIGIASMALFSSVLIGGVVLFIAFLGIVYSLGMIGLVLISPFVFVIGAHPGFGRGMALKWVELAAGLIVKRIGLSVVLTIIMACFTAIQATPIAALGQITLMLGIAIAMKILWSPMMNALNIIKIDGATQTGAGERLSRSGRQGAMAGVGALSGANAAVNAAGSKGTRAAFGDALSGGLQGAMRGGRGGAGTLRTVSEGTRVGKRTGAIRKADRARAEAQRTADGTTATGERREDRVTQGLPGYTEFDPGAADERESQRSRDRRRDASNPRRPGRPDGAEPTRQAVAEAPAGRTTVITPRPDPSPAPEPVRTSDSSEPADSRPEVGRKPGSQEARRQGGQPLRKPAISPVPRPRQPRNTPPGRPIASQAQPRPTPPTPRNPTEIAQEMLRKVSREGRPPNAGPPPGRPTKG
jgi:hypothetical protein